MKYIIFAACIPPVLGLAALIVYWKVFQPYRDPLAGDPEEAAKDYKDPRDLDWTPRHIA